MTAQTTATVDQNRLGSNAPGCRSAVSAFLARSLPNKSDVQDLTQEVFVRMLRRKAAHPICSAEAYALQIAANLVRERFRHLKREQSALAALCEHFPMGSSVDFSPERILLAKEACAQLAAALREVPNRARVTLVLRRLDGLTNREIAKLLGVSLSTTEKDLMRITAYLTRRLK